MAKKYYLASGSPRRQELFKAIVEDFEVVLKDVEENYPKHLKAFEVPQYLSELKSKAYASIVDEDPNNVVITADTVVVLNKVILGKPKDEAEAYEMLQKMSGTHHEVVTGITLYKKGKKKSFVVSSSVYFDVLTEQQIRYYIKNYQPFDKAGAYGIQEYIGKIGVKKIEGCFYNIMGLPVNFLNQELAKF